MRAVPERLRDVSRIGSIQIDITFTFTQCRNCAETWCMPYAAASHDKPCSHSALSRTVVVNGLVETQCGRSCL